MVNGKPLKGDCKVVVWGGKALAGSYPLEVAGASASLVKRLSSS